MKSLRTLPSFLPLLIFAVVSPVASFAGSVSGTIVFEGDAPEMRELNLAVDPVCAAKHDTPPRAEVLVLGEGQTMANVIVQVVKGLPEGKTYEPPAEPAVLTQAGCVYSPHVLVVQAGQPIQVLNPDGTMHNIHGFPKVNREFNTTMAPSKKEMEITFDQAEPAFRIKCDVHPWMGAYCAVLDHPYFDVTETDGAFTIEGLEPGEYVIEAWHERLGPQTATVTVPEEGAVEANFTFKRPE